MSTFLSSTGQFDDIPCQTFVGITQTLHVWHVQDTLIHIDPLTVTPPPTDRHTNIQSTKNVIYGVSGLLPLHWVSTIIYMGHMVSSTSRPRGFSSPRRRQHTGAFLPAAGLSRSISTGDRSSHRPSGCSHERLRFRHGDEKPRGSEPRA